jgi:hypothetical protein
VDVTSATSETSFQSRSKLPCESLRHLLIQIVHFNQTNSGGVVYTAHNRSVIAWLQRRDDRRLPRVARRVAAGHYVMDLTAGDDPADYRGHPVIIRGNRILT